MGISLGVPRSPTAMLDQHSTRDRHHYITRHLSEPADKRD